MRFLVITLLTFSWSVSAEKVCGLFQAEDFRDRMIYSLTDFKTFPTLAVVYTISNSEQPSVRSMLSGQCYCINGLVSEAGPDPMYQHLMISEIDAGPFQNCAPFITTDAKPL